MSTAEYARKSLLHRTQSTDGSVFVQVIQKKSDQMINWHNNNNSPFSLLITSGSCSHTHALSKFLSAAVRFVERKISLPDCIFLTYTNNARTHAWDNDLATIIHHAILYAAYSRILFHSCSHMQTHTHTISNTNKLSFTLSPSVCSACISAAEVL